MLPVQKKILITVIGLIIYSGSIGICIMQQTNIRVFQTNISEINNNPDEYKNKIVEVSGIVPRFINVPENEVMQYLLIGRYGDEIIIKTHNEQPEQFTRYSVKGVVYLDQRIPFIHQLNLEELNDEN